METMLLGYIGSRVDGNLKMETIIATTHAVEGHLAALSMTQDCSNGRSCTRTTSSGA